MKNYTNHLTDFGAKHIAKQSYKYAYHILRLQRHNWGEESLANYVISWVNEEKQDNTNPVVINTRIFALVSLCYSKVKAN